MSSGAQAIHDALSIAPSELGLVIVGCAALMGILVVWRYVLRASAEGGTPSRGNMMRTQEYWATGSDARAYADSDFGRLYDPDAAEKSVQRRWRKGRG